MKKITMRIIAFALVLASLCAFAVPASAAGVSTEDAGVLLDSFTANGETFTLTTASRIFVISSSAPSGDLLKTVQLVQQQFAAAGRPSSSVMSIVYGPEEYVWEGDIVVELDASSGIAADGYELDITTSAKVTASDTDGLLYGLNMLLKHMNYADSNSICGFTAKDEPDTVERTVHLDCGRKYFTRNWICNFIRQISWMGYNTLEFHFSEDGGFRADFWDDSYYKGVFQPENDFSWICGSKPQAWVFSPYNTDSDRNKYLTTKELVEICNTAAKYHIDIIPSFDTPSHVDYLTYQFEQNYLSNSSYSFTYKGTTYTAASVNGCINYTGATGYSDSTYNWPYYSAIDITNDVAKNFVFALYTDIANFFKVYAGSTEFNMGGDEVYLGTGYSYKWSADKFPAYVNEVDNLLNSLGYTTRIFNDFMGSTVYNFDLDDFNSDIEILYWNSPLDPNDGTYNSSDDTTIAATKFSNNNRVLYNVIQTGTYYCTRITGSTGTYANKDARDPDNHQWRIYNATGSGIYNDWNPKDFGEKGVHKETVDIPANKIAGAYFCLWHDFASLNTEQEIWYGATDKYDSSKVYYLFDRMWSNTIKMWNWDINNTVTYDTYNTISSKFSSFPGLSENTGACSQAVTLPTATAAEEATLADHSALTEAVASKISGSAYTAASYAEYEAAYAAAQAVNEDPAATAAEIQAVIDALNAAKENLVERSKVVEVTYMVKSSKDDADSAAVQLDIEEYDLESGAYNIYIAPRTGYTFLKASGTLFTESDSGDGSGYISGTSEYGVSVTLYYLNTPDTSRLEYMTRNEVTDSAAYTEESWAAYETALNNAKNFTVSATTTQADIEALITALETAEKGLVTNTADTSDVTIEKLTATARAGKQIGLRITTPSIVESLTVTSGDATVDLTLCVSKIQTLTSGNTVKLWLVYIPAKTAGTEVEYVVHAGSESASVTITIN